jgi:hypothetical protein
VTAASRTGCEQTERVAEYALRSLPANETAAFEAHIEGCAVCRGELDALRPIVDTFVDWPIDVLRPSTPLWARLAQRIATETGGDVAAVPGAGSPEARWPEARWMDEPEWKAVAPGISCKLLATDAETERVSMLVRLAPGVAYPPHLHAGVEELHLLDGELWIEDRKLSPGDYNRGEPGTGDTRVWSETGCTCVLVTSFSDILR